MVHPPVCRLIGLLLLGLLATTGPGARRAWAQPKAEPPVTIVVKGDEAPDKLQKLIDNVRKSGREVQMRFADPAPVPAATPASPAVTPTREPGWFERSVTLLRTGTRSGIVGIPEIPATLSDIAGAWRLETGGQWSVPLLFTLLAVVGFPALLAWFARKAMLRLRWMGDPLPDANLLDRFGAASRRLLGDVVGLVVFGAGMAIAAAELLPSDGVAREIARAARAAITQGLIHLVIGRFLLAPGEPHRRLLPFPRADWHFRLLIVYAVWGSAILFLVALSSAVSPNENGTNALLFVLGLPLTIYGFWWFWIGRNDVREVVMRTGADPEKPSRLRRLAAAMLPGLFMILVVVLWAVGRMATAMPHGASWGWAASVTQILIVLLPVLGPGAAEIVRAARHRYGGADSAPMAQAFWVVGERAISGAIWLFGLGFIAFLWVRNVIGDDAEGLVTGIRHLLTVATVLVIGYLIWIFLKAIFDAYTPRRASGMPGAEEEEGEEAGKPQSRLGTVMPLLRGFVLGAVLGLTLLLALARLGLDIGPLLAGFGILGLALSFGSQALVRDIVSGIFFMAEDAFRVGEYIDTGKLKGTVERISLRSVQLRHQSGQIHTVPYGQISSVTNASRDWATVKFPIRLDRSADIEKARKIIKKVGQDMQADADIGPDFILPVKLQGVSDIQDAALVVRVKFTAKPARTSFLQREALKRIYRALNEASVPFASNAVTVRAAEQHAAAAAAAAQSAPPVLQPVAAG